MKSLTYIEIDLLMCALTYGTAPCTAAVGVTGTDRCFNTRKTCQDVANLDLTDEVTLRFAVDTDYLPDDIEAIPVVVGVEYEGVTVSLGQDLGIRATLNVSFREFRHTDVGPGMDKYYSLRSYNPRTQGTFWARFRARQPYLRGRPLRLIRGLLGESLAAMETRHFVIEHFEGPKAGGTYTIIAKDALKLADNDRAKAPYVNNGVLNADLSNSATSFTLTPTGIGNLEYAASGLVSIGGKEVVSYTRSGDVFTITRGQLGTVATEHKSEDRVQEVLTYTGQDPGDIIYDLLVNYAGIPSVYISLDDWNAETEAYLQRVYTANIAEPTGVTDLVSELIEQAALAVWWDDRSSKIRLRVLRPLADDASQFTDENIISGTLDIREQPEQRLSEVWVYYGQRNPLEPLNRYDNYTSIEVTLDPQAEDNFQAPAIKTITSRWIARFGRTSASRVGALLLARYRDPPRAFDFEVWRSPSGLEDVQIGGGYQVGSEFIQDASGLPALVPVMITSLRPGPDRYIAHAEEMSFTYSAQSGSGGDIEAEDPDNHVITIDSDTFNFNLRTVHDSLYAPIGEDAGDITITVIINSGVKVGSGSLSVQAFVVGDWDDPDVPITIINNGRIQGRGGNGGTSITSVGQATGGNGGTAIYTRKSITIENNGEIYGGGGGGGGSWDSSDFGIGVGAGGAGYQPGANGSPAATTETGGIGYHSGTGGDGRGGDGGGFGEAGDPGTGGATFNAPGGAAGKAVDGVSYVTFTTAGTRAGPEVN